MKNKSKKPLKSVYTNALVLISVGSLTGVLAGVVVTLFTLLAHYGEALSQDVFAFVRANPAWIPLVLVALVCGAFLIGVAVEISHIARGCGIPQTEGAARGVLRFNWWKDATVTFAACLLSIFMGLSIGAEGPSVLIGSCMGEGVARGVKSNEMIKKYQITGGACTGLAVAGGAPLTGIVFAFEEAHKRFTPEVFICAFSSVIFGMLTRSLIYSLLGMEAHAVFSGYAFSELPLSAYGFVLLTGVLCGVVGVLFEKCTLALRAPFKKIAFKSEFWTRTVRIMIAVLLGGVFALISAGAMGGGHHLIASLSAGYSGEGLQTVFSLPLFWTLIVVFLLKFIITGVNVSSGIPCGIFIPIIAMGALLGAIANNLWLSWGMDAAHCDLMVMIAMAAFFATIVRAPLTAVIMVCEFTGSFTFLLPVVIAVSCGYFIGDISQTEGIYEELLERYVQESGIHERAVTEVYTLTLTDGAIADKREVKDVLWPAGVRVKEIHRGEEVILPQGDTPLHGGDTLVLVCYTDEPQKVKDELIHILQ